MGLVGRYQMVEIEVVATQTCMINPSADVRQPLQQQSLCVWWYKGSGGEQQEVLGQTVLAVPVLTIYICTLSRLLFCMLFVNVKFYESSVRLEWLASHTIVWSSRWACLQYWLHDWSLIGQTVSMYCHTLPVSSKSIDCYTLPIAASRMLHPQYCTCMFIALDIRIWYTEYVILPMGGRSCTIFSMIRTIY